MNNNWLRACPICGNKPDMIVVGCNCVKIVCPKCQLSAMSETDSNSWWDLRKAAHKVVILWGILDEEEPEPEIGG